MRASSIQYRYRKSGTHARALSQTLDNGNSETDRRQAKNIEINEVGLK